MNQILRDGQTVKVGETGATCTVGAFLGGGGQGEVYRADLAGQEVALKWYLPAAATDAQRKALEVLIAGGPPSAAFLWPMAMAAAPGVPGFGYVMPLRGTEYRSIVDLMKRRTEPTFRALLTAGVGLAHHFLELHARGLCYRDISFGNVFFDPSDGRVLICDNDNVAVDGSGAAGVLGTPRFMAPEVVRGETLPSTQTDLWSLAVLLFYMLCVHHPLEGERELAIRCLDLPAMTKLYGTEPLFVFDPNDASNRPVPGHHDNALAFWPVYPESLRQLFTKSFTAGASRPGDRVRESEWRASLVAVRDGIVWCPGCGVEVFTDTAAGSTAGTCWSCSRQVTPPLQLRVERSVVMLNHDTRLFPHHTDTARAYDFSSAVAEVRAHPTEQGVWGLANLSPKRWVATTPDGKVVDIDPGRSVRLAPGVRVDFGGREALVSA